MMLSLPLAGLLARALGSTDELGLLQVQLAQDLARGGASQRANATAPPQGALTVAADSNSTHPAQRLHLAAAVAPLAAVRPPQVGPALLMQHRNNTGAVGMQPLTAINAAVGFVAVGAVLYFGYFGVKTASSGDAA
eukprot:CAMPEP_0171095888 /NCGR_PEP_ID=MMETSP0766_2-20121228/43430_1 /TAXON_ID=439317 /ORGANISM="Gambierdiscus australes, Strain CAWD 149" /LENGTH=135 /DNA_ID=CAMNT_0011554757 /DNA_START=30 /DNA_END=434 /DNA_ORIENTATION=+